MKRLAFILTATCAVFFCGCGTSKINRPYENVKAAMIQVGEEAYERRPGAYTQMKPFAETTPGEVCVLQVRHARYKDRWHVFVKAQRVSDRTTRLSANAHNGVPPTMKAKSEKEWRKRVIRTVYSRERRGDEPRFHK